MAKAKKETSVKKTPYTRNKKSTDTNKKSTEIIKNKKPLTKSEKLKNANTIDDLDNLMNDLTPHLIQKKKEPIQIKNDTMEEVRE